MVISRCGYISTMIMDGWPITYVMPKNDQFATMDANGRLMLKRYPIEQCSDSFMNRMGTNFWSFAIWQ